MKKLITVSEAKRILEEVESKKDILKSPSLRNEKITVEREVQAMKSILKNKEDNETLVSVFSKSFLDMKKSYKVKA